MSILKLYSLICRDRDMGVDLIKQDHLQNNQKRAPGGNRTHDPWLIIPMLYPLSYRSFDEKYSIPSKTFQKN